MVCRVCGEAFMITVAARMPAPTPGGTPASADIGTTAAVTTPEPATTLAPLWAWPALSFC